MISQAQLQYHDQADADSPERADRAPAPRLNSTTRAPQPASPAKQRITITLPVSLLERLRNAVYWTGHSTLARLMTDALDDAVSELEETNGGPFPARLTPLKRGRPKIGKLHPSR
jgi:hypothetical protein